MSLNRIAVAGLLAAGMALAGAAPAVASPVQDNWSPGCRCWQPGAVIATFNKNVFKPPVNRTVIVTGDRTVTINIGKPRR